MGSSTLGSRYIRKVVRCWGRRAKVLGLPGQLNRLSHFCHDGTNQFLEIVYHIIFS